MCIPTIRFSVIAQDDSNMQWLKVEQKILDVTLSGEYDDVFINQGLSICNDYNSLEFEEKVCISKEVMGKYDAVLKRVAFVMQQRINNIITSQNPTSEIFQPTMELNAKITQLQWNYQEQIINLDQFEQLRLGLRESYLNDEIIPNYYIREQVTATEDEFLIYQQGNQKEPVEYPTLSDTVSQPTINPDTPESRPESKPESRPESNTTSSRVPNSNNSVKPVLPTVSETSSSSMSSMPASSEESSEPTSSASSEITSSEENSNTGTIGPTVSAPNNNVLPPLGKVDLNNDINVTVVYILAAVGALVAIALSSVIILKAR